MKPAGHIGVAVTLGGLSAIFANWQVALGAFVGSLLPDIDHAFFFWQVDPKSLASPKRFFELSDRLYQECDKNQWLELAFMHTAEVFLAVLWLALTLRSPLILTIWGAMFIHIFLDYLDMVVRDNTLNLRCWSIIQYFIRKRRGEKTYFELWPKKT